MKRAWYGSRVPGFLRDTEDHVLGALVRSSPFPVDDLQKNAWAYEIQLLKRDLVGAAFEHSYVFLEFAIPRMGKRVDVVLVHEGLVFVIEFKVGNKEYTRTAFEQAEDYGLDLKNFHSGSHDKRIVPMLAATCAPVSENRIEHADDRLYATLRVNSKNLVSTINQIASRVSEPKFDAQEWAESIYKPTPTIVEAAQALYQGHSVAEISRSDSGARNLDKTAQAVDLVIRNAKASNNKAICFITGVPGSGKTLAGLNIATERHNIDEGEHAVFLSGNGPLVNVLREALARNQIEQLKSQGKNATKKLVKSKTGAFIQNIHHFRDDNLGTSKAPVERVVVFDEAQRAWDSAQTINFMKTKRGVSDFSMSEPEFLIDVMDRHEGYSVIVCLIGGGQEINKGEAGIPEWFSALSRHFPEWKVYVSNNLHDNEYGQGQNLYDLISTDRLKILEDLHLGVSVRSFRAESVSGFVKNLLDGDKEAAINALDEFGEKYPIVFTRDLNVARTWLKWKARGSERYGIVASSGAIRLKPDGLNVKAKIDETYWFLNDKEDVRSSYYLEDVATEFAVQGLELDWVCVAWDANLYRTNNEWVYRRFAGTKWQAVRDPASKLYLKNAYRVLLTRARQGMVIYVPSGDESDPTRDPAKYDSIAEYLSDVGIDRLLP